MKIKGASIYATLFLAICMVLPSSATMGYDINARVDSQSWTLHRHTLNMNFISNGNVSGSGNFSTRSHLQDLAGLMAEESSYSLNGSLSYEEKVRYVSKEGPVKIVADINEYDLDNSEDGGSSQEPIDIKNSAKIDVDERWPAYFANLKSIEYVGSGIRSREAYNNNGDMVSSNFDSSHLNKRSLFKSNINRTIIHALITPQGVFEDRQMNKTSSFILISKSIGALANLEISRSNFDGGPTRFGRITPDIMISQDYSGSQAINLKVEMKDSVMPPLELASEWLECCGGEYAEYLHFNFEINRLRTRIILRYHDIWRYPSKRVGPPSEFAPTNLKISQSAY